MNETDFDPKGTTDIIGLVDSLRTQGLLLGFTLHLDRGTYLKLNITMDMLMDMDLRGIDLLHHPKVSFFTSPIEWLDEGFDFYQWIFFKNYVLDKLQKKG